VAAAVHTVPGSTMLRSPNEGGGYPFLGGAQEAKPGTAAFSALDTNGDGKLSMDDDPYSPCWPGDDAVDWVGLTLYHFGDVYPWGENEIPAPGKLAAKITGTYKTGLVDETAVPDFYATYAVGHAKPFAISETAAFYTTARIDGAAALEIKSVWWKQLFDPGFKTQFPLMKPAMWFEYTKEETVPPTRPPTGGHRGSGHPGAVPGSSPFPVHHGATGRVTGAPGKGLNRPSYLSYLTCRLRCSPYPLPPGPPGIPVIVPGERINAAVIDYLQSGLKAGMVLPGPALNTIRVLRG